MILHSHNGSIHINKHFHLQPLPLPFHLVVVLITQQGNFQVYNEHHYLNGKNTSKFPAVCSHFLPYLSLNNLPLWRRLCNKKASYVYFFPFLCFANAWMCFKEEKLNRRRKRGKSLKGKSSTFLPSEKFYSTHSSHRVSE